MVTRWDVKDGIRPGLPASSGAKRPTPRQMGPGFSQVQDLGCFSFSHACALAKLT